MCHTHTHCCCGCSMHSHGKLLPSYRNWNIVTQPKIISALKIELFMWLHTLWWVASVATISIRHTSFLCFGLKNIKLERRNVDFRRTPYCTRLHWNDMNKIVCILLPVTCPTNKCASYLWSLHLWARYSEPNFIIWRSESTTHTRTHRQTHRICRPFSFIFDVFYCWISHEMDSFDFGKNKPCSGNSSNKHTRKMLI